MAIYAEQERLKKEKEQIRHLQEVEEKFAMMRKEYEQRMENPNSKDFTEKNMAEVWHQNHLKQQGIMNGKIRREILTTVSKTYL